MHTAQAAYSALSISVSVFAILQKALRIVLVRNALPTPGPHPTRTNGNIVPKEGCSELFCMCVMRIPRAHLVFRICVLL